MKPDGQNRQTLIKELAFNLQKMASFLIFWHEKWRAEGEDENELAFEEINGKYPTLLHSKEEVPRFFSVDGARFFASRYIESFTQKEIEEIIESCAEL